MGMEGKVTGSWGGNFQLSDVSWLRRVRQGGRQKGRVKEYLG